MIPLGLVYTFFANQFPGFPESGWVKPRPHSPKGPLPGESWQETAQRLGWGWERTRCPRCGQELSARYAHFHGPACPGHRPVGILRNHGSRRAQ